MLMGCKNLSRHTFITTLRALLLYLMRVTHKFPHSAALWWQCSSERTAPSVRTDSRGGASCRMMVMMMMSVHMTAGRPLSAEQIWMLDPQAHRLTCSVLKHQLRWSSEETFVMMFLRCSVMWWLLNVLSYLGSCILDVKSVSMTFLSLWSVSTTSLLPVCGLYVSAAAAVMFILSATPPPLCTQTRNTWGLVGSFIRGWSGAVSGCLFVSHVTI